MRNLNTNLQQSTNYLIELFYRTNKKYTCTRTKLGKLLSIVAFKYAMEDKKLFNETIYKYNDCGCVILELKILNRDIYIQNEYFDNNEKINEKDLVLEDIKLPNIYLNSEKVNKEIKESIKEVFLEFGAYSTRKLSKLLDEITDINGIANNENVIILENIKTIDFEKNKDSSNKLFKFLNTKY